jgi:hypothetical protein
VVSFQRTPPQSSSGVHLGVQQHPLAAW